MSARLELELPFPPSGLNPNRSRGLHWAAKGRIAAQYRENCGWVGIVERKRCYLWEGFTGPVEADVTFVVPDRRRRDQDNLLAMLKPAWDGLVDAGVLSRDDYPHFKMGKVSVEVGEPKVIVVLSCGKEAT